MSVAGHSCSLAIDETCPTCQNSGDCGGLVVSHRWIKEERWRLICRDLEGETLPNVERIVEAAQQLLQA